MNLCYLGPFTITSDAIIVADTGCDYNVASETKQAGEIVNPLSGEWGAYIDYSGLSVTEIIVCSSDVDINDLHEKKWKEMSFTLKSTTGQICIFDKTKYQNDDDIIDILSNSPDVLIDMAPSLIKGEMWHMACMQMTNMSDAVCIAGGVIYCSNSPSKFCAENYKVFRYYQNDMCIAAKIKIIEKTTFYQSSDESVECLSSEGSSASFEFSSESDDTYIEMVEDD
jgi:hypothetical protein